MKHHVGIKSKATGQIVVIGGARCQRFAFTGNGVVTPKAFDTLPDGYEKCQHCEAELARARKRLARKHG